MERMTVQEIDDTFAAYDKAVLNGTANTREWDSRMKDARAALTGYSTEMRASLAALGSSVASLGKSLGDGETGAAVFGGVLTAGSDTLSTFAKKGGPAAEAFALVIKAGVVYVNAVAKQADSLYKGFQDVSRTGTVGFSGMKEVYSNMQKFGYGIKELDKFGALMSENSKNLAAFGGSAVDGGKAFANLATELQHSPVTESLLNMGVSVDEINRGAAGYLKQQIGYGQNQKTMGDKLKDGTLSYITELETISRLTGQTRQQQEEKIADAQAEQAFNAKISQLKRLELSTDAKEAERAKKQREKLEKGNLIFQGGMRKNFIRGAAGDLEALGGLVLVGGEDLVDAINNPDRPIGDSVKALTDGFAKMKASGGEQLAMMNSWNGSYPDWEEQQKLETQYGGKNVEEEYAKAKANLKTTDSATKNMTATEISQRKARDNLQDMINFGIDPVTKAVEILSKVIEWITDFLPGAGKSKHDREMQKQVDATKTTKVGVWNKEGNMVYVSPDEAKKIKSGEMAAPKESTAGVKPSQPAETSTAVAGSAKPAENKGLTGKDTGGLEKSFADALRNAANEYFSLTGKQVRVESALRSREKQQELYDAYKSGKSRFPAGAPGTSNHEKGLAVDVDLATANDMDAKGILGKYGLKRPVAGDPIHISAKDGFDGTLTGPTSGYQPQITMHGTEALKIEPLGETALPVEPQNNDEKTKMLTIQLESLDTLYRSLVKQNDYSNKILQQTR